PVAEPLIQRKLEPAAKGMLPPTTTSFADDFARGRQQFHDLGCAGCHQPMMVLKRPVLVLDGMPPIDLAHELGPSALRYDPALGGYPVWLFSDLKRHDMGAANAARHVQNGVGIRDYLTPRLWGVADSAPYLHDGRAPSFDYAIAGHDGEGAAARAAYAALGLDEKGPLRVYLMSLRRVRRARGPSPPSPPTESRRNHLAQQVDARPQDGSAFVDVEHSPSPEDALVADAHHGERPRRHLAPDGPPRHHRDADRRAHHLLDGLELVHLDRR